MKIYQGDLAPDLTVDLTIDDQPVDLTTATNIRVIGLRGTAVAFDRTATGTAQGVVVMPWQAADTATVGRILVEVEVTWPGGKPQTFRPGQAVDVLDDYA